MSEPFVWTSPEGVTVTLPALDSIPAGVFRRHRNEDPTGFVFSVLEDLASAEDLAKVDEIPLAQVNDLFMAWKSDDGASVPQS